MALTCEATGAVKQLGLWSNLWHCPGLSPGDSEAEWVVLYLLHTYSSREVEVYLFYALKLQKMLLDMLFLSESVSSHL